MDESVEYKLTLEDHALLFYRNYWREQEPYSKYEDRWEKMKACCADKDFESMVSMWRAAMMQAYLAGVALRLTEGAE